MNFAFFLYTKRGKYFFFIFFVKDIKLIIAFDKRGIKYCENVINQVSLLLINRLFAVKYTHFFPLKGYINYTQRNNRNKINKQQ